jgi:ubiquinone/menaquinone biosynthesis C-methylase UbiE
MPLKEPVTVFKKGFEFDFMAQRPMYRDCPRWLIEHCKIGDRSTVVDLGCGSGIVTRLLLEQFHEAPEFRIIAIDPSEFELSIARSRISDDRVTFFQGKAQDALSIVDAQVDAVLLCNVLHQIPLEERKSILEGAFALVRPGGFVGANTLFYDGGIAPETRPFYSRWMAEAREYLAQASSSWSLHGDTVVALQRLSPRQHEELFQLIGFEDVLIEEVWFKWLPEDWEALSKYSVFIRGALSQDVDLALGSTALIEGAKAAYRGLGITTVNRGWLHCVARRPAKPISTKSEPPVA